MERTLGKHYPATGLTRGKHGKIWENHMFFHFSVASFKFHMDIQHDAIIEAGDTFSKSSFLVSMLNFNKFQGLIANFFKHCT